VLILGYISIISKVNASEKKAAKSKSEDVSRTFKLRNPSPTRPAPGSSVID
jgi:hypothetical protein